MTNCEHLIENALMRMQRARLANMDTYEAFQDEMNWRGNREMLKQVHMTKEELWEIVQYIMYVWEADDWADLLTKFHDLDDYKDTYLKVNGPDYPDVCDGCSNNPKNGGSGICSCTLPYMQNPTNYNTQIGDPCMANNLNGYVYEISTDCLDNMHQANHERIAEAIERTKKYVRE
jgi:hypothetical protein